MTELAAELMPSPDTTKKGLPGEILCDEAYYTKLKEIQDSVRNGTHPEVRLNKGGTLL